jgi:hypothetical protein
MRLLGRLIVMAIGYVLAAFAGFAVGTIGALQGAIEWINQHAGQPMLDAVLLHMEAEAAKPWAGAGFFTALVLAPLALIALAAVIGEVFAIRNWFAWSFGLAIAFAAIPSVLVRGEGAILGPIGFFAAGFAAGCFYWLIAGAHAGRLPPEQAGAGVQGRG